MKDFYSVKDIMEATGLSKGYISKKIQEGEFKPYRPEYRFYEGRSYKFTEAEFERIVEKYQKPGMTTGEVAKLLNLSQTKVHQLIETGKLKAVHKKSGKQIRKYVTKEEISKYIEEFGKSKQTFTHYVPSKGYFLFQPFEGRHEMGRVVELHPNGEGTLVIETGEEIKLSKAMDRGFQPFLNIQDLPYSNKAGWVSFEFPKPRFIKSPIYAIIELFYSHAGAKNLKFYPQSDLICIDVKPCILEGITMKRNGDEIEMMREYLKEGELIPHPKGLLLVSDYVDVRTSIHKDLKLKMDHLVSEHHYSSIKDFVAEALQEKIERMEKQPIKIP